MVLKLAAPQHRRAIITERTRGPSAFSCSAEALGVLYAILRTFGTPRAPGPELPQPPPGPGQELLQLPLWNDGFPLFPGSGLPTKISRLGPDFHKLVVNPERQGGGGSLLTLAPATRKTDAQGTLLGALAQRRTKGTETRPPLEMPPNLCEGHAPRDPGRSVDPRGS